MMSITMASSAWACFPSNDSRAVNVSQSEMTTLRQGGVLVRECPGVKNNSMRLVMARMIINRPMASVWTSLMNQENIFQNEPHMKKVSTLVKAPGGRQDVSYALSISSLLPTFNYVTRIQFIQDSWTANFNRISGSFKAFKGFASLSPVDEGQKTMMTYALQVDPGFLIPQFVVRNILKSELPSLMGHIRTRVAAPSATGATRPKKP
ncbi:MAG: hypothetical protein IPK79_09410 [Vampirovibrionales bacterium]|nr:hypothetical protein [Vampirovibrionales bacterium]